MTIATKPSDLHQEPFNPLFSTMGGWCRLEIVGHLSFACFAQEITSFGERAVHVLVPDPKADAMVEEHIYPGRHVFGVHPCTREQVLQSLMPREDRLQLQANRLLPLTAFETQEGLDECVDNGEVEPDPYEKEDVPETEP